LFNRFLLFLFGIFLGVLQGNIIRAAIIPTTINFLYAPRSLWIVLDLIVTWSSGRWFTKNAISAISLFSTCNSVDSFWYIMLPGKS